MKDGKLELGDLVIIGIDCQMVAHPRGKRTGGAIHINLKKGDMLVVDEASPNTVWLVHDSELDLRFPFDNEDWDKNRGKAIFYSKGLKPLQEVKSREDLLII